MQSVSLFFVFFLVFANAVNAQNFFTGEYKKSDLKQERPVSSPSKKVVEKQKEIQTSDKTKEADVKTRGMTSDAAETRKSEGTNLITRNRSRIIYESNKSADNKTVAKKVDKDESSQDLKDFPPIPMNGKSAPDNEDIYNPKDINLSRPAVHDVNFFMNDKNWKKDSEEPMPEKKKALYIGYILPPEINTLVGGLKTCRFGIQLDNRSGYKIKRVRLKYIWRSVEPDPETGEYIDHTKELVYTDVEDGKSEPYYWRQPGKTLCEDYAAVKFPRVKVESCIIEGKVMTQLQCAKLIKLKK